MWEDEVTKPDMVPVAFEVQTSWWWRLRWRIGDMIDALAFWVRP